MSESVAILGGGIGGLAAAHHLARAGVRKITVYEASDAVGGKARSQYPTGPKKGTAYPGEHGFRFFPHFYRHLLETLRQIPAPRGSVWDQLVAPKYGAIAYDGRIIQIDRPVPLEDDTRFIKTAIQILMLREVTAVEATRFAEKLLLFATSCEARRKAEYDNMSWSEFTSASEIPYTKEFDDIVIRASKNLSAMRAENSSAATIGAITLQLLFTTSDTERSDALLCSPTDEAWLSHWRTHLASQGVQFELGVPLTRFDFDPLSGRIERAILAGGKKTVEADYYVCAIPLDRLAAILDDELMQFDAGLGKIPALAAEACGNMAGLQFFLRRSRSIVNGHLHYPGTPFALTSISQGQFWSPPPGQRPNRPNELRDVMSVIISDWETRGTEGLPAKEYVSRDALLDETWRQLKGALPPGTLRDDDVIARHLDSHVHLDPFRNETPLLIHPVGQYRRRPDAETAIENLFLASDFVRTYTDLATMEGAEEAARRATRAILARMGVAEDRWPPIHPLDEGSMFATAKRYDHLRFQYGWPHVLEARLSTGVLSLDDLIVNVGGTLAPYARQVSDRLSFLPRVGGERGAATDWLNQLETRLRGLPEPPHVVPS